MEQLKKLWEAFINFLATYDSHKISELVHNLKWEDVLANPYVWLIGLSSVGYMVVKKRFKTLVLIFSLVAFLYLVQTTLPSAGETIPLENLLKFIGGSVILGGLNLYLLFVRSD